MNKLIISLGRGNNLAAITAVKELTWAELCTRFSAPPPVSDDKSSAGWYCPAEFRPVYRDSKNFVARYALTFDYDKIDQWDLTEIEEAYKNFAYVLYTTASHAPEKPRVRMLFPLSRPATLDEFCCVTRTIGSRFDLEKLARESDTPAQMMFLPTRKADGEFWVRVHEGNVVDVDGVLGGYDDWTDRSKWPVRLRADSVGAIEATPPDEKSGVVGDFCRAFRVPDAIARFELPYVPGSTEDRFTYALGSRPDGLRIYDDGLKGHSDHDTDPANGQSNAFDLVRLHRFGTLDSPEDLAKPITERPSYRAMVKLAMDQPEIQQATVAQEFVDLGPLPLEDSRTEAAGGASETSGSPLVLARPLVDVLNTPSMPRWLLRDKLEAGVIALMAGPRGSYKSFIALDWAMSVSVKQNAPVYVVSAEGADFDRRSRAWLNTFAVGRTPGEVPLYVLERRLDLNTHENIELIRQDCQRLGVRPQLFVLDTFSKLSGGLDENSNTDVKAFIGRLDNGLKRAYDATVLLIAHTGHTDKGRARGASALEADTDAAYIVVRNDTTKSVMVTRQRFKSSPELEPLWLKTQQVELGYVDADGMPVNSLVLKPTDAPRSKAENGLTENQTSALRTSQHELAGAHGGEMPMDALVAKLAETMVATPGKRDQRDKRAAKVIESLIAKKVLTVRKGKVSLTTAEQIEEWE